MAVFKCKMCGASLDVENTAGVVQCEYCGSKQTLPNLDDERRASMYDRANHFRRNNEFDKAAAIFEQILNDDNTDAEAYWSLVLCKYGVEYVEDPATRKRLPTIHRAQYTSVYDDENYKAALEYADSAQAKLYKAEAKALNEIQKGILEISQNEDPFDVFICYKETDNNGRRTPDSVLANDLYHQLTQEGFKVFFSRITLEDKIGSAYEPYIFSALNSAKVMVVLGTKPEYFNAVWVKNEWSRYLSLIKGGAKKALIPAYKDMDAYDLPDEFSHLQAQDMSKLGFMQDLLRGIRKLSESDVGKKSTATKSKSVEETDDGLNAQAKAWLERAFLYLEDGESYSAEDYAEKVLDFNPKCAKAYLIKLLHYVKEIYHVEIKKIEDLAQVGEPPADYYTPFDKKDEYKKYMRFASESERKQMEEIVKKVEENKESKKEEKKEREYQEACRNYNSNNISWVTGAQEQFYKLGNYKNAPILTEQAEYKRKIMYNSDAIISTGKYFKNSGRMFLVILGILFAIGGAAGAALLMDYTNNFLIAGFVGVIGLVGLIVAILCIRSIYRDRKFARSNLKSAWNNLSRIIKELDEKISEGVDVEGYKKLRDYANEIYSSIYDKNGRIKK